MYYRVLRSSLTWILDFVINARQKINIQACDFINLPDVDIHNEKVENAIQSLRRSRTSFAMIDKGRTTDKRSCICVENTYFYGVGYITFDIAIADPAEIKDYVTLYKRNQYIMG